MKCFVCGEEMTGYFQKKMRPDMPEWNYVRCGRCGLVLCQTVYEMSDREWEKINDGCGEKFGHDEDPDDPRWVERLRGQAELFANLAAHGIWEPETRFVDYGCGDGKLADYVQNELSVRGGGTFVSHKLLKYEKYLHPEGPSDYLPDEAVTPGSFDMVVTCSVFEHLLGRPDVDEIVGLLKENGTLCMHTLVCEEVPQDPDWFYLLGGHCTLWTNNSMSLLFEQYGFTGCAYHVQARMWLFFRDRQRFEQLKSKCTLIPGEWIFSDQFVDYWKQKPYR